MSAAMHMDLGWLPRAPADFAARVKALKSAPEPAAEIRALASAKVVSSGSPRAEVPGKARGAPRDEDAGRKPKRAKATPASRAGSKAPRKPPP